MFFLESKKELFEHSGNILLKINGDFHIDVDGEFGVITNGEKICFDAIDSEIHLNSRSNKLIKDLPDSLEYIEEKCNCTKNENTLLERIVLLEKKIIELEKKLCPEL